VVAQHAARTAENSAAHLLPHLEGHHVLLDVGCGPGTITRGLARRVARVEAVDNADAVLEQARAHCAAGGSASGGDGDGAGAVDVRFVRASAHALPYEDGQFDVVHCHQLLQHLSDPVGALREMRRVCRPGGIVAVRESIYSTMRGAGAGMGAIERWRDIYMAVCRRNGAEPDAGLFAQRWMLDAGFGAVRFSSSVVTYSAAEGEAARRAWGEAWADRTLHSFGGQALEYGVVGSRAALEEVASGWRAWAADPAAVFLYVNGEVIARR
jgi:SAM-dependent methyltransferase